MSRHEENIFLTAVGVAVFATVENPTSLTLVMAAPFYFVTFTIIDKIKDIIMEENTQ